MNFLKRKPTVLKSEYTDKELKYHALYMDIAKRAAEMSFAERKKVGCVIEKDGRIISMGWNGMPSDWDNVCETKTLWDGEKQLIAPRLVTKPEVLHAEANAITKLARDGQSSLDCTVYTTLMPCMDCAKLIYQAGIKTLVYHEKWAADGIEFLQNNPNFNIIHLENY